MKEILEKYSTRQVNVSGRNKSLVTRKLYKKSAFDIVKLDKFDEDLSSRVIKYLCNRDTKSIKILEDPYKWYTQEHEKIEKEILKSKDKEIAKIKSAKEGYDKASVAIVEEKFKKKLQDEDGKLKRVQNTMIDYSNSLKTLIKEVKSTEKETGRYELYVGYPFVEGYFKDKTFIKAPLFLFPVEAVKTGDSWSITNKLDSQIILNKVFLIGYAKYNEEKLCDIKTEYDDLSDLSPDYISNLLRILKNSGIYVNNKGEEISIFKEVKKSEEPDYKAGELNIKNNVVIGHFNIANSIYTDYREMLNRNLSNNLMKKLLKNETIGRYDRNVDYKNESKGNEIEEKELYFISDLDYSQELAVMKSVKNSQLVIYGPPGTGKSQTIVNIVSQYLSQGKKVLMVSQKKAALDVIFNRSGAINSKMIMFNREMDKKQFYARIGERISALSAGNLDNDRLEFLSDIIDNNISRLESLEKVLTKKSSFGLTMQEMYTKQRVSEKDENISNFFREYRKSYPFEDYTYDEMLRIKETLFKADKAMKFYKLKHVMGNNKYSLYAKENIDIYDLEDSVRDIEELLNNYKSLVENLNESAKYLNSSKEVAIGNSEVDKLADNIAVNEHGYLLEKLTDGNKFSIKYWLNLKKNRAQEEENLRLYAEKLKDITEQINSEVAAIKNLTSEFNFLNDVLVIDEVEKLKKEFDDVEKIINNLKLIQEVLERYNEIASLKGTVNDINDRELKVIEYIHSIENEYEKAKVILENIDLLSIQVYIGRLQREHSLELDSIDNYEVLRKEVSNAMKKKREQVPQYINQKWDNIAIDNMRSNDKLWKMMYRECTKKSRLLQIREFVSRFQDSIFDLYPCWLLSPEAVSEVLPLVEGLFDVIIFDEASQMFIESAIPTIYRGKRVVVAGDDKQLRPSAAFSGKYVDEEEEYDMEIEAALEEESLLDLAKYNFDSTSLYYHYRSKYDELINFSNYAFYGGKLEVSPNISKTEISDCRPIERIKVDGKWIDRKNSEEALEVVRLVKNILLNRKNEETIGIITFNITQRDLIDELLEIEAAKDPVFGSKYYAEIDRIENNEDISLFIKNIENVQGDERDIIIFSTGYAKNEKGRVTASFGSLSQEGGENRLNVAISRAKEKVYVVTSIEPEDLNVDNSKNKGPRLLKKYLQYVRAVSDADKEAAKEILYSVCDSEITRNADIHYDSDFENQVHDALEDAGLIVDTQIGVSGYKIDLGIYDERSSKYILGIECDGAAYHSSKSARERDIYRQRYLESRGWYIVRIWSKDWWNNPKKEIEKIVSLANEISKNQKKRA